MIITREIDYALRILRKLQDYDTHTAKEISASECVPEAFSYKILSKLSKAGITNVARGSTGGYRLAKDLKEISMKDLVKALEVRLYLNECLEPSKSCAWKERHGCHCTISENLGVLQEEVLTLLSNLTIYDLIIPQKSIMGSFGRERE